MHIQLDTLGGIAGDMFVAAVLDALPELTNDTIAAIRATGIPPEWGIAVANHQDHVFRGMRFDVCEPVDCEHAHHQRFRDIVHRLQKAPLSPEVCDRAVAIFNLLAQAEAEVHGVELEDVTFHEVGAWDSVADIVAAAYLIEALGPTSWSIGSIPLGGGRVETAHGQMPVPAPATVKLLEGFTFVDDGIIGERVTPTGAAILRYLQCELGMPSGASSRPATLDSSGTGFGTNILPGISNVLRVLIFDDATEARIDDRIGVIQFEVDDQTAEDLAMGLDALRGHEGVLDVIQMPAIGKKGRMVFHLQVLCRQDALDDVIDACFMESTTIGLRWTVTARAKLDREMAVVDTKRDSVAVKLSMRPDGRQSAKIDVEGTRSSSGYIERQQTRQSAEQSALLKHSPDDSCSDK